MITVTFYKRSDGKPVKGAKVSIHFGGSLTGTYSDSEYTDAYGEASFDNDAGRSGKIYVNGQEAKSGHISGEEKVYI